MPPDDPENWLHEPWLTKPQLAEHLAVSDRWIEMQQHVGLPYLRMGGLNRYSLQRSRHGYESTTTRGPRAAEQCPRLRRTRYIANDGGSPLFALRRSPSPLFGDFEPDRGDKDSNLRPPGPQAV